MVGMGRGERARAGAPPHHAAGGVRGLGPWPRLGAEYATPRWRLEDARENGRWPTTRHRASFLHGPRRASADHRLGRHCRRAIEIPRGELTRMVDRDADYYQAHKDDPEEWGEPKPSEMPRKRRLAAMISVRFTPEEEAEIRRVAQSKGNSVSQFIREMALREVRSSSSKAPTVPISALSSLDRFLRRHEPNTRGQRGDPG